VPSGCLPKGEGNEVDNLSGWYAGDVRVSGGVNQPSKSDPGPLWGIGPDNQQMKISFPLYSKDS